MWYESLFKKNYSGPTNEATTCIIYPQPPSHVSAKEGCSFKKKSKVTAFNLGWIPKNFEATPKFPHLWAVGTEHRAQAIPIALARGPKRAWERPHMGLPAQERTQENWHHLVYMKTQGYLADDEVQVPQVDSPSAGSIYYCDTQQSCLDAGTPTGHLPKERNHSGRAEVSQNSKLPATAWEAGGEWNADWRHLVALWTTVRRSSKNIRKHT